MLDLITPNLISVPYDALTITNHTSLVMSLRGKVKELANIGYCGYDELLPDMSRDENLPN